MGPGGPGAHVSDGLEQNIFIFYQNLHNQLLVPHVMQGGEGAVLRGPHQGGPKHDPQIFGIHEIVLLIHGNPAKHTQANHVNLWTNKEAEDVPES